MAITDQTTLEAAVASWAENQSLGSVIPDFVTFATERLNRDLRLRFMEKVDTGISTVAGTREISLPSDFLEMRSLYLDQNPVRVLRYLPPDHFFRTGDVAARGNPRAFTVLGTQAALSPIPDAVYSVVLWYTGKQTTQQWIDNATDTLLYASLVELAAYEDSDSDLQKWSQLYHASVATLQRQDTRSRTTRGSLQMQRA